MLFFVANSSKYNFDSKSNYEGFKFEIIETDYEDRGVYFCCFDSSSNSSVEELKCQEFTLRVKGMSAWPTQGRLAAYCFFILSSDPLGWLWPLIGIICEAILIVLILLLAAKFKAKKEESK